MLGRPGRRRRCGQSRPWSHRCFVTGRNAKRSGPTPIRRYPLDRRLPKSATSASRRNSPVAGELGRASGACRAVTKALAYLRIRFSIFADARAVSATGSLEALSRSPAGVRCWQPLLRANASAPCDRSLWPSLSISPACSRYPGWRSSSVSLIPVASTCSLLDSGCQPVDRARDREKPIDDI